MEIEFYGNYKFFISYFLLNTGLKEYFNILKINKQNNNDEDYKVIEFEWKDNISINKFILKDYSKKLTIYFIYHMDLLNSFHIKKKNINLILKLLN
jgi:hypothetical protein